MPIQGGSGIIETVIKEKPMKWWQKVIDWHGLRRDQGKMIVRQTELIQVQGEIIGEQRDAIILRDEMAVALKSLNDELATIKDDYIEYLEAKVKTFESGCQCIKEEK